VISLRPFLLLLLVIGAGVDRIGVGLADKMLVNPMLCSSCSGPRSW